MSEILKPTIMSKSLRSRFNHNMKETFELKHEKLQKVENLIQASSAD